MDIPGTLACIQLLLIGGGSVNGNLQLVAQPATLGKEFIIPPQHCREQISPQHPADMQPMLH